MKSSSLLLSVFFPWLIISQLGPPPIENIAQLLVERGLAKINTESRKDVFADMVSIKKEYDINSKEVSKKISRRTILGRPKLDKLSIDELYQAFETRYYFYIDDLENTVNVDNITYGVIKYKPKADLKINKTADQFINRVEGKIYIDIDKLKITKIEGAIPNKFSFDFSYWALLFIPIQIDMHKFEFSVEYATFNNISVENHLTGLADYEVRNRGTETHEYILSNYRMR